MLPELRLLLAAEFVLAQHNEGRAKNRPASN